MSDGRQGGRGRRILIVDEDVAALRVMELALGERGYDVATATSVPEAAERVLAEARIRLWAQAAGIPYVARELEGKRGRIEFKMREPEFRELEEKLRGLKGGFAPMGPEGCALHLPARELREEVLEERTVRVLKRLAE